MLRRTAKIGAVLLGLMLCALGLSLRRTPVGWGLSVPSVMAQTIWQQKCQAPLSPIVGPTWQVSNNVNGQLLQWGCLDNIGNLQIAGIVYVGQPPSNSTADVQINQAISDLPNGGTIDARNLTGTQFISSQINVGNSSGIPVTLLVPSNANWGVTITGGTTCGLRLFNNANVIAQDSGSGNQANISASSASTNVLALACTDESNGGTFDTFRLDGLSFSNANGGTMADSVVLLRSFKDNSIFTNSNVVNPFGAGLHIGGSAASSGGCCMSVENVWVNGSNGGTSNTTAQPVSITCTGSCSSVNSVRFFGGSVVQPGLGQNGIKIDGGGSFKTADIGFFNVHAEGSINSGETTTPFLLMTNSAANVNWIGGSILFSFGTNYSFRLESSSAGLLVAGARTGHNNLVNNAVTGIDAISTTNGNIGYYNDQTGFNNFAQGFTSSALNLTSTTFANLGTPINGTMKFCSDCNATCTAGAGTGRTCARENGAWVGF